MPFQLGFEQPRALPMGPACPELVEGRLTIGRSGNITKINKLYYTILYDPFYVFLLGFEQPRILPRGPTCPEPAEGACPEPAEGACPEPAEGACPELACPEPVEGSKGVLPLDDRATKQQNYYTINIYKYKRKKPLPRGFVPHCGFSCLYLEHQKGVYNFFKI